jgi:hypothetical protein
MRNESRFRVVERASPDRFRAFLREAHDAAQQRYSLYTQLAGITVPVPEPTDIPVEPATVEDAED